MSHPTLVIARLTFFEAARRKILLAALVVGVIFLTVYTLGLRAILADLAGQGVSVFVRGEILNFLSLAGLYVVHFLTIMLSVLTSVDTISGEISSGTMQTILTKPLQRHQVLLGKWLGFAVLLLFYVLLMGGGVVVVVQWLGDFRIPNVLTGLSYLLLNGWIMMTVSLLGGTFLSTLANGVLVFGLFGVAFVGSWIEQIGSVLNNAAAVQVGIVTSLVMPSEALWRRMAFLLQSPLAGTFGFSPFSAGSSTPSRWMVVYAVVYLLAMLGAGLLSFSRRDV